MSFLLDTNVLARSLDKASPQHPYAQAAIARLMAAGEDLCITPQVIMEFARVATAPLDARGGWGMTPAAAAAEWKVFVAMFRMLPDTSDVFAEWERLVVRYGVRGLSVYDARLVAVMVVHKVDSILTFDGSGLARFVEVSAVHPEKVSV